MFENIARFLIASQMVLSICMPNSACAAEAVYIYAVGHQDDWQLFMSPTVFAHLKTEQGSKIVFIYVTAGDGGLGNGTGGHTQPFYLARENGALRSTRFVADVGQDPGPINATTVTFAGHAIYRVIYKNTVSYFLRLPDGNGDGKGFAATNFQSLQLLREGNISLLSSIEGSTSYSSWGDLVKTLKAIIDEERRGVATVGVNIAETDNQKNPGDHSDHIAVSHAVKEAISNTTCISETSVIEYFSASLPRNLLPSDEQVQTAALATYISGLTDLGHGAGEWEAGHLSWLGRSYRSVRPALAPCH